MKNTAAFGPLSWLLAFVAFGCASAGSSLPEPSYKKLPRWRGFNLCEKFTLRNQSPFVETDFQWISQWGFNFARLPMDYRCWIKDGDWEKFNEKALKEIDQAIAWGKKYDIHVSINFHRAPGYCVNPPAHAVMATSSSFTVLMVFVLVLSIAVLVLVLGWARSYARFALDQSARRVRSDPGCGRADSSSLCRLFRRGWPARNLRA